MQKLIQITDITPDELISKICSAIIEKLPNIPSSGSTTMITVLNKREAAKILNISESCFNKFQDRGVIPCTVIAGYNKKHQPIKIWCQSHLIIIKPIILKLRYSQSNDQFIQAKREIYLLLNL